MRWVTLIGRLGTVLLVMSLALGLVWLIPSQPPTSSGRGGSVIQPQKYWLASPANVITPQTEFDISAQSNGTVLVYLLDVYLKTYESWARSWVSAQYPGLGSSQVSQGWTNVTVLNALLEIHPDTILWKSDTTNNINKQFFPDKVGNLTLIVANPSSSFIRLDFEYKVMNLLAPKPRVLLLVQLLAPIGLALTVPPIVITKFRKAPSK